MKKTLITILAASSCLVFAQTYNGTTGDAVWDIVTNWTGDPTATQGTFNGDGDIGNVDPTAGPLGANDPTGWVEGFDIIQTGGIIRAASSSGSFIVDTTWVVNGGQFGAGTVRVNGTSSLTINNTGSLETTGGRDLSVGDAGGTLTLNAGGSISVEDDFSNNGTVVINGGTFTQGNAAGNNFSNGGTFTVNGGTLDLSDASAFGDNGSGAAGTMNFNGGTTTGNRLKVRLAGGINFGGTTAGSVTATDWGTGNGLGTAGSTDRADDRNIQMDFSSGSLMTLNMGVATRELDFDDDTFGDAGTAWAEALWTTGRLTFTDGGSVFSGLDPDTNGWSIVSWGDASSSSDSFGTGEYFDFTAAGTYGGSLSLAVIPEPSSIALMGIAGLAMFAFARKRRA